MNSFFHSFCNLLINKGVKRSRFARYDSMQHHVYASHTYTYIRYRYCFFLWTLSFLKIWIHFLIPDVHLCNTSYYVGFESCSYEKIIWILATQYYSEYYLLHKHRNKNNKYALLFVFLKKHISELFPIIYFLLSAHME